MWPSGHCRKGPSKTLLSAGWWGGLGRPGGLAGLGEVTPSSARAPASLSQATEVRLPCRPWGMTGPGGSHGCEASARLHGCCPRRSGAGRPCCPPVCHRAWGRALHPVACPQPSRARLPPGSWILQPPRRAGGRGGTGPPPCTTASAGPAPAAPASPGARVRGSPGRCTARADDCTGAAGNIEMPPRPAEPLKPSLSCIRDLSSNNKGNGQEIRDK